MHENLEELNFIERFNQRLDNWVKVPHYDDPEHQIKAEIIHILATILLVMGLVSLTITPFVYTNLFQGVGITIGLMTLVFLVRFFNRRGHTQISAMLLIGIVWVFDILIVLFSGGFRSHILSSLISIVIIGGLILGEMYAFYMAGITITAYFVLFLIDTQGLTPNILINLNPISLILLNSTNLILAATTLILVMLRNKHNIRELVLEGKILVEANQDLELSNQTRKEEISLLRQNENRLKSALMNIPYPTMLHADNGEILLVNDAWLESSGFVSENLPRFKDWLDHLFRDNSTQILAILDSLARGEDSKHEGFFDILKKSGESLRWYTRWTKLPPLKDGRTLILTTATDMTKFISMESALRETEESLSTLSLVTNDGLWDWDLLTDRVIFDPHYYTMAGYEVNEFPHQLEEFRKRVHPDDVEDVFNQAEAHLNGESDRFNVEFRFLQKDGSWLWVMGRGKITEQDANGNPLRFVGTHTDINAQKDIEEKLNTYQLQLEDVVEARTQELNERITEVERLNIALTNILDDYQAANERLSILRDNLSVANEELESLTYSLSTDLLKPILSIQEKASYLIKKTSPDLNKKELDTLQGILANAELVNQQINDLVRISQLSQQELQITDIDPVELIKKVLKSYDKEIKEYKIKIIIKDLPPCRADRDLLEIVFDNLINNGIKFSSEQKTPEIQIGYQPDQYADRVIYYVQDNGVGFNPEDKNLVFNKFQQLNNQEHQQGNGIGLTLVKLIVNKHNGSIWAESDEGKGATFYFDLPSPVEGDS